CARTEKLGRILFTPLTWGPESDRRCRGCRASGWVNRVKRVDLIKLAGPFVPMRNYRTPIYSISPFYTRLEEDSLSSLLSSPTKIAVDALYRLEDGVERRNTLLRKHDIRVLPNTIYEQFAVVKSAFITELGVLFFINNVRLNDIKDEGCPIAEVRRSAGMSEVASKDWLCLR
ncbi:hypothetical protein N7537_002563, partial [Penicillium hordei]